MHPLAYYNVHIHVLQTYVMSSTSPLLKDGTSSRVHFLMLTSSDSMFNALLVPRRLPFWGIEIEIEIAAWSRCSLNEWVQTQENVFTSIYQSNATAPLSVLQINLHTCMTGVQNLLRHSTAMLILLQHRCHVLCKKCVCVWGGEGVEERKERGCRTCHSTNPIAWQEVRTVK